jgi:hypothetical protein
MGRGLQDGEKRRLGHSVIPSIERVSLASGHDPDPDHLARDPALDIDGFALDLSIGLTREGDIGETEVENGSIRPISRGGLP